MISSEELFRKVWKEEYYKNSKQYGDGAHQAFAGKNEWTDRKVGFHQDRLGSGI